MDRITVDVDNNDLEIPKLLDYEVIPEPMWADDTGRESREGEFSGTFVGYFTNITINIGPTSQEEYTQLCSMFQRPLFSMTFIREDDGELHTETFYGTALKAKKDKYDGKYKEFSIQLVSTKRRED